MAKRVPVIMERMVRATTTSMRVQAGRGLALRAKIGDRRWEMGGRERRAQKDAGVPTDAEDFGTVGEGIICGR
jgi:hypothetical protein